MIILPHRKTQISKLAEDIAHEHSQGNLTLLNEIADFEGVPVHYDNYEDAFDGMLVYDTDSNGFHIHINIDNGNCQDSNRGRFTLAHELGHFFLDEHRLGLKYGILEPHASFHNINQKSLIEEEADYFASCLLIPKDKLRKCTADYKKINRDSKFSFATLRNISDSFQTSISATVIRYAEIGTYEIFAVFSQDGIVKWFTRSSDFPNLRRKFQVGMTVPSTSVVKEWFEPRSQKFDGPIKIDIEDWFIPDDYNFRISTQLFEECCYSDNKGFAISLIWFD